MGLIAMSERDLQRIEVLSKVVERRMTIVAAAHVLALSPRQVRRLLERLQTDGAAAIRHKARGQPSNNRISGGVRDYAMVIVRERSGSLLDDKHTGGWMGCAPHVGHCGRAGQYPSTSQG